MDIMINLLKKRALLASLLVSFSPAYAEVLLFEGLDDEAVATTYDILEVVPNAASNILYGINGGTNPSVESFEVLSTGELQHRTNFAPLTGAAVPEGVAGAKAMAFSPTGQFMLIANDSDNTATPSREGLYAFFGGGNGTFNEVKFYRKNSGDPLLNSTIGIFDEINATAVAVSANGENIYVVGKKIGGTNPGEGVIGILSGVTFNAGSNLVEYTNIRVMGGVSNSIPQLISPVDVGLSSDGNNIYVLSSDEVANSGTANNDALLHFVDASPQPTFRSFVKNGAGVTALDGPADMVVTNSAASGINIFIAASQSGSIIQLQQADAALTPALKKEYNSIAPNSVLGLTGVSKLLLTSSAGMLYAAATGANQITSFIFDNTVGKSGLLIPTRGFDENEVREGLQTSTGRTISGITSVNRMALSGSRGTLYATSSLAGTTSQIARFSKRSRLSTVVNALNPHTIQPGQLAQFQIIVTNGISNSGGALPSQADAPGFILTLSGISHQVVTSTSDGTCVTTEEGNTRSVECTTNVLKNGATFTVDAQMTPQLITTAGLNARATSRNTVTDDGTSQSSDSASVAVGEFKNGTLSFGVLAHLALLVLFIWRRREQFLNCK